MVSTKQQSLKIFLCHAADDKPQVRRLDRRLARQGFRPWLDERELRPGEEWREEITKAVRASDVVIICMSQKSVSKSGFVQREIRLALDVAEDKPQQSTFIIPVLLEPDVEVPANLLRWQCCSLYAKEGYRKLLESLQTQALKLASHLPAVTEIEILNRDPLPPDRNVQYTFGASAFGVAGEIYRPVRRTISSQASVVLSLLGGHGTSRVDNFRDAPFLSFDAAYAETGGAFDDPHQMWTAHCWVVIEGFNLLDMVTMDRAVMRIAMYHHKDEKAPEFDFTGSYFENLKIAGYAVELKRDPMPYHLTRMQLYYPNVVSGIKKVKINAAEIKNIGNVIEIPKFGSVVLMESVRMQDRVSLTMLRIELEAGTGRFSIATGSLFGGRVNSL
jgi:hypothetical protein